MDNDRPTRQEILERFGWQPGEKEQADADLAQRARIDRERMNEARQTAQPAADTKTIRERRDVEAATVKYWKNYIEKQIDQQTRAIFKAIAPVVVAEEKARARADDGEERDRKSQCEDICRRFADHPKIEEFVRLRVKVASLEERLAALEAAPAARTLKSVG